VIGEYNAMEKDEGFFRIANRARCPISFA